MREKRYATNSAALRVAGFGVEPGFYYLSQFHRIHSKLNMRASCRKNPNVRFSQRSEPFSEECMR